MTFDEALKAKYEIGETIEIQDLQYKVFVVPYNENDFSKYLADYIRIKFDDNSAKLYSTNSKFKVCALWQNMSNFLYKILES
jgi:hypothetical protein